MKYRISFATWIFVLTMLVVGYQNCGRERLEPLGQIHQEEVRQTEDSFCVKPPEGHKRFSKILFVVDKSGSNRAPSAGSDGGSDEDKSRRSGGIQNFFDKHKDNDFYKWGFIQFGAVNKEAESYILDDSPQRKPGFGDRVKMQQAIDKFKSVSDDGCTPYIEALKLAHETIKNDLLLAPDEDSIYNVFFLSDGRPDKYNDSDPDACGNDYVERKADDPYLSAVKDIRNLAPEKIFISTIYYYSKKNQKAADGLRYMAEPEVGGGTFTEIVPPKHEIEFNEVSVGELFDSWQIKRMVTYNLNAGFCNYGLARGTIGADSDADGLCDSDELELNKIEGIRNKLKKLGLESRFFDPLQRFSILEEYSDLVSLELYVKPPTTPNRCDLSMGENLQKDKDFDLLNGCEERLLNADKPHGPDQDWDSDVFGGGQNDADPANPDSDGDGFLDSIELFTFRDRAGPVVHYSYYPEYRDGLTHEDIMREHRHPYSLALDDSSYDPKLKSLGKNSEGFYCYEFSQSKLALYPTKAVSLEQVSGNKNLVHGENENIVLAYYIATPEKYPTGKGVLFYSYQRPSLSDKTTNYFIKVDQFQQYKIPKRRKKK